LNIDHCVKVKRSKTENAEDWFCYMLVFGEFYNVPHQQSTADVVLNPLGGEKL